MFAAGVALVMFTFVDALWTTLWPEGAAGPLTSRLSTLLWRSMRWVAGPDQHRLLNLAGPLILITAVVAWVILIAAGWTMVFSAQTDALLEVRNREPADFVGRVYFVLYSMFTLGNGDYVPQGGVYQLATAATVASGMFLITLAITYLLSVISAAVDKRSFASYVSGFGQSPEKVVLTAWDGAGFDGIGPQLAQLTSSLGLLSEQHQAYPILHYYHPVNRGKASAVAIMIFDEALMIMEHAVLEQYRPRPAEVRPARQSVTSYLQTLASAFVPVANHPLSPPDLDRLRERGVPVIDDRCFAEVLEQHSYRRRMLLGLLANDGWTEKVR